MTLFCFKIGLKFNVYISNLSFEEELKNKVRVWRLTGLKQWNIDVTKQKQKGFNIVKKLRLKIVIEKEGGISWYSLIYVNNFNLLKLILCIFYF